MIKTKPRSIADFFVLLIISQVGTLIGVVNKFNAVDCYGIWLFTASIVSVISWVAVFELTNWKKYQHEYQSSLELVITRNWPFLFFSIFILLNAFILLAIWMFF